MYRLIRGSSRLALSLALVAFAGLLLGGCVDDGRNGLNGSDGSDGMDGMDGAPGPIVINASTISDEALGSLDVVSEILGVTIASPPVVTFKLTTSTGVPIVGIVPFWEDSNRYIRFTLAKLVPGEGTAPDNWVSYTRDGTSNAPDYDTGSSVTDNGDGTYTFVFNTDVANVAGVPYDPTLTHRIAGQLGSRSVPLEPQNFWDDFVPNGAALVLTRNITTMDTCNECHDDLVFHGRRFLVEYCVNCHNADLAAPEGEFSWMIHRIHDAGEFTLIDDGDFDASHVTYPQDVTNCRRCHNAENVATAQGDNWREVPGRAACDGCHDNFNTNSHTAGPQPDTNCKACHSADQIEEYHLTENATPFNPFLPDGQRNITYELIDATVNGANEVIVNFKVLDGTTALDVTNLPADLADPGRFPGLLLAWALPQGDIDEPMDYNNMGRRGAQPRSLSLGNFSPMEGDDPIGTVSFNASTGVNTAVVTESGSQFPVDATLRAVGIQGYFQQDIGDDTASLHTPSFVVSVTGDTERRSVIDSDACAKCHEWFEGHGGNRVRNMEICLLCHVPNQSSSGRTTVTPSDGLLEDFADAGDSLDPDVDPNDPLTYPEDAQNFKDMIHGIHAEGARSRSFTHVRGGRQGYYDWSHITFPRGASTSNCTLCHKEGTFSLPLANDLLATTVRTSKQADGMDGDIGEAEEAFQDVPNGTDWINSPTASSCFYCHTTDEAMDHMVQNGGLLSHPKGWSVTNRQDGFQAAESCSVCHGPGKTADIAEMHDR